MNIYLSTPCESGIHLPIGFSKNTTPGIYTIKQTIFIIIKIDLLDISRIKFNKLQTVIKMAAC